MTFLNNDISAQLKIKDLPHPPTQKIHKRQLARVAKLSFIQRGWDSNPR